MGGNAHPAAQAKDSQVPVGPDVPSAEELFNDEALERLRYDRELESLAQTLRQRELQIEACIGGVNEHTAIQACLDIVRGDLADAGLSVPESALDDPEAFFAATRALPVAPSTTIVRRQAREVARIVLFASQGRLLVPTSVDELRSTWELAMLGEPRWSEDFPSSEFRTGPITLRGPLPEGEVVHVCMDASEMPAWLGNLVGLLHDEDMPVEIRATAGLCLNDWIHPFSDGNGHVGRFIELAVLGSRYSLPTLAFLSRELVVRRGVTMQLFNLLRSRENDVRDFCLGMLGQVGDAQKLVLQVFGSWNGRGAHD